MVEELLVTSAAETVSCDGTVVVPIETVPVNVPVPTVEKFPVLVVVALPLMDRAEETDKAVVDALPRVVCPVMERPKFPVSNPPNVPVDAVENAPVDVVVALPLTQSALDTDS